jgi:type VI secretion system secreted protein VgrG
MSETPPRVTCELTLGATHGALRVHAVRGVESLSELFRYEVDLSTDALEVDGLPGTGAHALLRDSFGQERHLDAIVEEASVLAHDRAETRYRLVLRPSPWLLTLRRWSRAFQGKSATDVVVQVFGEAGLDAVLRPSLGGRYDPRPWCVQHEESEWDLACRLLEDEGVWFAFAHAAEGHTMTLWDNTIPPPAHPGGALPYVADDALHGDGVRVWSWATERRPVPSKVILDDHDWLQPTVDLRAEAEEPDPDPATHHEYPGGYSDPGRGQRLARIRLDALRAERLRVSGVTSAFSLTAGERFTLVDHPTDDGEYLVTRATLTVRFDDESVAGPLVDVGRPMCEVAFEAIPAAQPYRPLRRTPRPKMRGLQTAIVTGPSSEEIYTDEHGRVKVQFHWDREGGLDEASSHWVRVAQPHMTGAIQVPRKSWEVLVDFLDGDPDRPVCLGRLFNADHPPQFALPAQKAVSALRTASSPGAEGINELVLDDTADAERVAVRGHFDVRFTTERDASLQVDGDLRRTVGQEHTVEVGDGDDLTVRGDEDDEVVEDHGITVGESRNLEVKGRLVEEVGGTLERTVDEGERVQAGRIGRHEVIRVTDDLQMLAGTGVDHAAEAEVEAADETIDAVRGAAESAGTPSQQVEQHGGGGGGVHATTVKGEVTVRVGGDAAAMAGGGLWRSVGANLSEKFGGSRTELVFRSREEVTKQDRTETHGGLEIRVDDALSRSVEGDLSVELSGDLTQEIDGGRSLQATGALTLEANEFTLEATEAIVLKCGAAKVVITADAVSIEGVQVKIEGSDRVSLTEPAIMPG